MHVIYHASDHIHYGIFPLEIKFNSEFIVELNYEDSIISKEKLLSEEMAQHELGLIGNPDDRVRYQGSTQDFLEGLDKEAIKDLGFSFQSMINVLQIMSFWPMYARNVQVNTNYFTDEKEIENVCLNNINGIV